MSHRDRIHPQNYVVTSDTVFGRADLASHDYRFADRTLLTDETTAAYSDVRRTGGRPSLSGEGRSRQLAFRVPDGLYSQLESTAAARGESKSDLAREALREYLARHPAA